MRSASPVPDSRFRFVALALGLLLAAPWAQAGPDRLSRDLRGLQLIAGGEGRVDVIITYAGTPTPEALRARGAAGLRSLHRIRGIAANVAVSELDELAGDPGVRRVSWDEPVAAASDVSVAATGAWLARQAGGIDGSGIRVAVVDSGVAPVPALGGGPEQPLGRIAAWVDLVEPNRPFPTDPYGHGTHVAGIIAGAVQEIHDPAGRTALYGGFAPAAEIVSVRVLDRDGRGRVSDVIEGLGWVIDNADELGIRIVNLSLGHPSREPAADDPLVQACEDAWEAGLVVVTSAGNHGRDARPFGTISSPGNGPSVITVGALVDHDTLRRSDDTVATYSSLGPTRFDGTVKPDLVAPGDSIVSSRSPHSDLDRAFPDNRVGSTSRGASSPELFRLSGTSMAAAAVTGSAALLLSADPDLGPDAVKARLMRSAEKREESIWERGAGALDVVAALDDPGRPATSASPAASVDGAHVALDGPAWDGWVAEDIYGPGALWDLDLAWDFFQAAEPDDSAPLIWQVPPDDGAGGFLWQRVPGPSPSSVVWQVDGDSVVWQGNRKSVGTDSVVWQGSRKTVGTDSVVWQGDRSLKAESVVWQGDRSMTAESVVWQGDRAVTAESVVWQGSDDGTRILILGEAGLQP